MRGKADPPLRTSAREECRPEPVEPSADTHSAPLGPGPAGSSAEGVAPPGRSAHPKQGCTSLDRSPGPLPVRHGTRKEVILLAILLVGIDVSRDRHHVVFTSAEATARWGRLTVPNDAGGAAE